MPTETKSVHTFHKDQRVRLTPETKRIYRVLAEETYIIQSVLEIPEDLTEDGACPSRGDNGDRSFAKYVGACPGERTRDIAGHHQWIYLAGGYRLSGNQVEPAE